MTKEVRARLEEKIRINFNEVQKLLAQRRELKIKLEEFRTKLNSGYLPKGIEAIEKWNADYDTVYFGIQDLDMALYNPRTKVHNSVQLILEAGTRPEKKEEAEKAMTKKWIDPLYD